MVLEVITEKFKQHRLEAGIKIGREQGREEGRAEGRGLGRAEGLAEGREQERRATNAWYERQQAAFRAGLPFDEPPPGYAPDSHTNGAAGG